MAVALTAPGPRPPTAGLESRDVVDPETLELWRPRRRLWIRLTELRGDGSGRESGLLPPATCPPGPFAADVGLISEAPVASSLVFLGAGVAGIYHVSTAPAQHGRGG